VSVRIKNSDVSTRRTFIRHEAYIRTNIPQRKRDKEQSQTRCSRYSTCLWRHFKHKIRSTLCL